MCRNIKTLFNFDPPATDEEIRDAALQFVRKLSGFNAPSKANQQAFDAAVDEAMFAERRRLNAGKIHSLCRASAARCEKVQHLACLCGGIIR